MRTALLVLFASSLAFAQQETRLLWPDGAPGALGNEEIDKPSITLYLPAAEKANGAAVVVCPGGGYHILVMDLEGTEICDWLNSIGVTGVLLKYRVPKREGLEKHAAALQDAQRALGLLRQNAAQWRLDPKRLGVLGFSAGGHLAAVLSNNYDHRTYSPCDPADTVSCRPDFTILIYPAYLTVKEAGDQIAPELNITSKTPPTFMAMAADDSVRVETAAFYALALRKASVPFELHIYPTGGHGYGLRPSKDLVTTWPQRAADWLRSSGFLEARNRGVETGASR